MMNSATIPTEKSSKVESYKAYQRYKQSQKKEQIFKNKTPLKMTLFKKRLSLIQENNKEIDNNEKKKRNQRRNKKKSLKKKRARDATRCNTDIMQH